MSWSVCVSTFNICQTCRHVNITKEVVLIILPFKSWPEEEVRRKLNCCHVLRRENTLFFFISPELFIDTKQQIVPKQHV